VAHVKEFKPNEANRPAKPLKEYRGFFGCPGVDYPRLVRARFTGAAPRFGPKKFWIVDCPACGERHRVEIWWRQPNEKDREPELELTDDSA
jgi:hypothetical protein